MCVYIRSAEVAKDNGNLSLHTLMRIYFFFFYWQSNRFWEGERERNHTIEKLLLKNHIHELNNNMYVLWMYIILHSFVSFLSIFFSSIFLFGWISSKSIDFFPFKYEHSTVFRYCCHFIVLCYQIVAFKLCVL